MLKYALALVAALILVAPAVATAGLTSQERAVLKQMNRVRAEHGLRALRPDSHLQRAANWHTQQMLTTDDFAHGAFVGRMRHFAVACHTAGEDLAWGVGSSGTAREIVAAWLASPEHRANLLSQSYTRVGVGALTGSFRGYADAHVITADFAG